MTVLIFCSEGSQTLKKNEVSGLHKHKDPKWSSIHFRMELDLGPQIRGDGYIKVPKAFLEGSLTERA